MRGHKTAKTDEPLWYATQVLEQEKRTLRAKLYSLGEDRYPDLEKMLKDELAQVETALKQLGRTKEDIDGSNVP